MYRLSQYYVLDKQEDDDNAVELFAGTVEEVSRFIGRSKQIIYRAANDGLRGHEVLGKFVYRRDIEYQYKDPRSKRRAEERDRKLKEGNMVKKRKTKFEKKLEQIKTHLDHYGNTGIYIEPTKYLDALAADGYLVSVKHEPKRVIRSIGGPVDEIFDEIWILTLEGKVGDPEKKKERKEKLIWRD